MEPRRLPCLRALPRASQSERRADAPAVHNLQTRLLALLASDTGTTVGPWCRDGAFARRAVAHQGRTASRCAARPAGGARARRGHPRNGPVRAHARRRPRRNPRDRGALDCGLAQKFFVAAGVLGSPSGLFGRSLSPGTSPFRSFACPKGSPAIEPSPRPARPRDQAPASQKPRRIPTRPRGPAPRSDGCPPMKATCAVCRRHRVIMADTQLCLACAVGLTHRCPICQDDVPGSGHAPLLPVQPTPSREPPDRERGGDDPPPLALQAVFPTSARAVRSRSRPASRLTGSPARPPRARRIAITVTNPGDLSTETLHAALGAESLRRVAPLIAHWAEIGVIEWTGPGSRP